MKAASGRGWLCSTPSGFPSPLAYATSPMARKLGNTKGDTESPWVKSSVRHGQRALPFQPLVSAVGHYHDNAHEDRLSLPITFGASCSSSQKFRALHSQRPESSSLQAKSIWMPWMPSLVSCRLPETMLWQASETWVACSPSFDGSIPRSGVRL